MLPITSQIASEMDVLYGLYQLAIDYTRKIEPEKEDGIVKWLDTRQRILSKTATASGSAVRLLKIFQVTYNVPANEKALIEEKRNMVRDIIKKMQRAEYDILKKMHKKMKSLRGELVNINHRNKAAQAYMNAPQPALFVS
ncbi:hypothetical protein ACFL5V_12390 [Fibrobacterota bacterium]